MNIGYELRVQRPLVRDPQLGSISQRSCSSTAFMSIHFCTYMFVVGFPSVALRASIAGPGANRTWSGLRAIIHHCWRTCSSATEHSILGARLRRLELAQVGPGVNSLHAERIPDFP